MERTSRNMTALRLFMQQGTGTAHEIVLHYRADLFPGSCPRPTVARHLTWPRSGR
jgi:hypothetical protein